MGDGGFTPSQIRLFTLADVNELWEWWAINPPLRVTVLGIGVALGITPPKPPAKTGALAPPSGQQATIASIREQYPDGLMRG